MVSLQSLEDGEPVYLLNGEDHVELAYREIEGRSPGVYYSLERDNFRMISEYKNPSNISHFLSSDKHKDASIGFKSCLDTARKLEERKLISLENEIQPIKSSELTEEAEKLKNVAEKVLNPDYSLEIDEKS